MLPLRLPAVSICIVFLDRRCWPFPSGTREEGPAVREGADRSPGKTETGANVLLWGSEVEVFGSHPDWLTPPSPHCPLQDTDVRQSIKPFTLTGDYQYAANNQSKNEILSKTSYLADGSASTLFPLNWLSWHSPSIHWKTTEKQAVTEGTTLSLFCTPG